MDKAIINTAIQIIPCLPKYQGEIAKMLVEIALEFEETIFSKSTNRTATLPNPYWVALCKEEVVGTVGVLPINNHKAILKSMMVKKTFRGKQLGLSDLLLQTALNWCQINTINQVYLGTMTQFKAAQSFYLKNGFQRISIDKLPDDFINNPLDSLYFYRHL